MQHSQLNGMLKKLDNNQRNQKLTMGELISALQDATEDDHMVPALFGDLKNGGIIKVNEAAVMQAWMEAPEHLRKA